MNYIDLLLRFEDTDEEDRLVLIESFLEDSLGITILDSLELVPENYYEIYFSEQLMTQGFDVNHAKLFKAQMLQKQINYEISNNQVSISSYIDFIAAIEKSYKNFQKNY